MKLIKTRRIIECILVLLFSLSAEASGNWVSTYNGSSNGNDLAKCIKVDVDGNIIVAGDSQAGNGKYDFLIIKYSPAGELIWTKCYNGPANGQDRLSGIAVDRDGNIYAAGHSKTKSGCSFSVVKYDKTGNQLWAKDYPGARSRPDSPQSIALDADANIYTVGSSATAGANFVIKYDSGGNRLWVKRCNGYQIGLATDDIGNVYVVGDQTTSPIRTFVKKFNEYGSIVWTRFYSGTPNRDNFPAAFSVDGSGNVFICGTQVESDFSSSYLLLKYGVDGHVRWVRKYRFPGNDLNSALGVALDNFGNVHVTGNSCLISSDGYNVGISNQNTITLKYDLNGRLLWSAPVLWREVISDYLTACIALGSSGDVYVARARLDSSYNFVTLKHGSADGGLVWTKVYGTPANGSDIPTGIATDIFMNVYVTGTSMVGGRFDFATLAYSP